MRVKEHLLKKSSFQQEVSQEEEVVVGNNSLEIQKSKFQLLNIMFTDWFLYTGKAHHLPTLPQQPPIPLCTLIGRSVRARLVPEPKLLSDLRLSVCGEEDDEQPDGGRRGRSEGRRKRSSSCVT